MEHSGTPAELIRLHCVYGKGNWPALNRSCAASTRKCHPLFSVGPAESRCQRLLSGWSELSGKSSPQQCSEPLSQEAPQAAGIRSSACSFVSWLIQDHFRLFRTILAGRSPKCAHNDLVKIRYHDPL